MYKVLTLTSAIALSLMLITSCGTAQKVPTTPAPPAEEKSDEDRDRGFDPCLVNHKLPSCK